VDEAADSGQVSCANFYKKVLTQAGLVAEVDSNPLRSTP
jgi:hypothetical protein